MTEAAVMGLCAGVVGLVLCLAFGLGELVGDLARRAARKFEKPKCNCPLPPMPAAATVQPAEPTDIDSKVW